jgi:hypothetical protein
MGSLLGVKWLECDVDHFTLWKEVDAEACYENMWHHNPEDLDLKEQYCQFVRLSHALP